MSEIDKIKLKISALLNKTTDNGCTEAEALMAAEKAGELLDHYQLSMSDIQIKDEKCVLIKVKTGGIKRGPVDGCVIALARYCDVKVWFSKGKYSPRNEDGELIGRTKGGKLKTRMVEATYGVFGLKSDTEIFEYLFGVIKTMMAVELDIFQQSEQYTEAAYYTGETKGAKLSATMSFLQGMASGVGDQLYTMKENRVREMREATGRDLVIVKDALIEEEFKDTGITLSRSTVHRRGGGDWGAKGAGRQAGQNMNLNGGLGQGDGRKAIA